MRAVTLPHFPHPCLAVLWRNWNRVPVARLARVLQAPEAELKEAASLMGLDGGACDMRWLSRGYLTLIRSNWHLLTYEGLTELLGITREKLDILRQADFIFRDEIAKAHLEGSMNQYFAVLTSMRSVGVMGDGRTYDYTLALRSVTTTDFMTADWTRIPYEVLDRVSVRIVNEVPHINRIVYDITSKPPATIEWE